MVDGVSAHDIEGLVQIRHGSPDKVSLIKALITHPCTWVCSTLILAVVIFAIVSPAWCPEVARCSAVHAETSVIYNACTASALGAVFLHELVCLCLTFKAARGAMHIIHNLKDTLIPSAFLCATFIVLFIENIVFVSETPWYANAMTAGDGDILDGEPVYTVFYLEWLINVPILMILAGKYALRRPMTEVARPLIVTNVYIILAWAVHFIPGLAGRMVTLTVTFLMYFWASYDMVQWVTKHRKGHPEAHWFGRPFLSIALIVIFGIYGFVFLCRQGGAISTVEERMFFMVMDASTKLLTSVAFAGLRSSQYHNMLLDMVVNTNTVFQRDLKQPAETTWGRGGS